MTANTSFKSVIANASTEGYAITLEDSAKALVYDPESFMPAAIEDLALAPGHAKFQFAQAIEVVRHALTFPTIDAYIDRSLSIMEKEGASYETSLFSKFEPGLRHIYMFQRHLGLALALEHEWIDDILNGLDLAFLRGDSALELSEHVLADSRTSFQIDYLAWMFQSASSQWDRLKLNSSMVGMYRPDGSMRSLPLMGLLFWPHLSGMLENEIAAGNPVVVRAIYDLSSGGSHYQEWAIQTIKCFLSLKFVYMQLQDVKSVRSRAGVDLAPDAFEIRARLERYLQLFVRGEESAADLIGYILSGNHDVHEILHEVLQFNHMKLWQPQIETQIATATLDFARGLRPILLQEESAPLKLGQVALGCFFDKGGEEYQELLRTADDKLLDALAQRFTPAQCVASPALLALCGSRPFAEYEDWCQGFDELGLVAEALYKITDDQAYRLTVNNLNTRARMFYGDLGV